jgi:hypothetical protein
MARDNIQGQSYPYLPQIKDIPTRDALRYLMDQVNSLRQPSATLDMGGNKITGVTSPTADSDVTTKSYVDSLTSAAKIRESLTASGATPLDVTALRGRLSQVQRPYLALIPSGDPLPVSGQEGEVIVQKTGIVYHLLRYDSSSNTWVKIT